MNPKKVERHFTVSGIPLPREGWTEPKDVLRTAAAAASLVMTDRKNYSPDDRADCASEVVARLYASVGGKVKGYGGLPTESATFTHCYNLARNYRKSLDSERAREGKEKSRQAAADMGKSAHAELELPPTISSPLAAAVKAATMLDELGLWVEGKTQGPLWTVAYTAARVCATTRSAERDSVEETRRELGLAAETATKHRHRARKAIPSLETHSVRDHAEAMGMPTGGSSHPGTLVREWRERPAAPAAVTKRIDKRRIRKTRRPPQWAKDLAKGTKTQQRAAARLAKSAAIRDARAEGKVEA